MKYKGLIIVGSLIIYSSCSLDDTGNLESSGSDNLQSTNVSVTTRTTSVETMAVGRVVSNVLSDDNLAIFPLWAIYRNEGEIELTEDEYHGITFGNVPSTFITDNYIVDPTHLEDGSFSGGDKQWPKRDLLWYSMAVKYVTGIGNSTALPFYVVAAPDGTDGWYTPYVTYTTPSDLSEQQDIIVACAETDETQTTGDLNLAFHHILSQIEVKAKIGSSARHIVKIAAVKLSNINTTGRFDMPTTDAGIGTWVSYSTLNDTESSIGSSPITLNDVAVNIHFSNYDFWTIPQKALSNEVGADDWDEGFCIYVLCRVTDLEGVLIYPYPEYGEAITSDNDVRIEIGGEHYAWAGIPLANNTAGEYATWEAENKYTYTLNFTSGAGYADPDIDENKKVLGELATFEVEVEAYGVSDDITVDPFGSTEGNTLDPA